MDSLNRRISDPNYVRLALSGLDELFADQYGIVDVEEVKADQGTPPPAVTAEKATGTLDAAEFLEHYFGVDSNTLSPETAPSGESIETTPIENREPASKANNEPPDISHIDITGGAGLDLTPLLDRLREAHAQIQSAHYRIGFLEYEIDTYKDKLKLLEDVEARAARAAAVEKENQELKKLLPLVEARANKVALVKRENEQLQVRIRELERKRGGVFSRFLGLIFGD